MESARKRWRHCSNELLAAGKELSTTYSQGNEQCRTSQDFTCTRLLWQHTHNHTQTNAEYGFSLSLVLFFYILYVVTHKHMPSMGRHPPCCSRAYPTRKVPVLIYIHVHIIRPATVLQPAQRYARPIRMNTNYEQALKHMTSEAAA